ncbi:MAG: Eco57I restriction-modification methylase domain-containing protein, partial [Opitutaceae bacterium]
CQHYLKWFYEHPKEKTEANCYVDTEGNLRLTTHLKRQVLLDNIFGVDLDQQAVQVTMLSLYLKILEGETRSTLGRQHLLFPKESFLPDLSGNIMQGNSLIEGDYLDLFADGDEVRRIKPFDWHTEFRGIMKVGGFDAALGNPPYVFGEYLDPKQKRYLETHYDTAVGQYDLYHLFFERALKLLKPKGFHGYVVPDAILARDETARLRRILLGQHFVVRRIFHAGQSFEKVNVSVAVVISQRAEDPSAHVTVDESTHANRPVAVRNLPVHAFRDDPLARFFIALTSSGFALVRKLQASPGRLRDFGSFSRGEELGKKHLGRARRLKRGYGWILVGEDVERFHVKPPSFVVRRSHISKSPEIYAAPKLVIVKTGDRPVAALERKGYWTMQSLYNVCMQAASDVEPQILLCLINSSLLAWYLSRTVTAYKKMFPQFNQDHFEDLPIADTTTWDKRKCQKLVQLANRMEEFALRRHRARSDSERQTVESTIRAANRSINELVYDLYGLTKDEIALVEQSLPD